MIQCYAPKPVYSGTDVASFTAVIASSGMGKTQMAFSLSAYWKKRDKNVVVAYFCCATETNLTQDVYRPHVMASFRPWRTIMAQNREPVKSAVSLQHFGHKQLWRFFAMCLLGEDSSVDNSQALRKRLADSKKKFVVFIDETPPDEYSGRSRFEEAVGLRNALRALGICPVLMSTHSGALNAVTLGGSSGKENEKIWCTVVSALPTYVPPQQRPALSKPREALWNLISGSGERPRVKRWVLEFLKADDTDDSEDNYELLDALLTHVQGLLHTTKPSAWEGQFQLAQLMGGDVEGEKSHCLIGGHFGHREPQGLEDLKADAAQHVKTRMRVRLPTVETEPILVLALLRWCNRPPSHDIKRDPPHYPVMDGLKYITLLKCYHDHRSGFFQDFDTSNAKARKRNGDHLEVLALAACTLASMSNALRTIHLPLFLSRVRRLLCTKDSAPVDDEEDDWSALPQKWRDLVVPIIPPANDNFAPYLGKFFHGSRFSRPADDAKLDGIVCHDIPKKADPKRVDHLSSYERERCFVSIECKNHEKAFGSPLAERVFKRIPPSAQVAIIVTREVGEIFHRGSRGVSAGQRWKKCLKSLQHDAFKEPAQKLAIVKLDKGGMSPPKIAGKTYTKGGQLLIVLVEVDIDE